MQQAYREGVDLHRLTAAHAAGCQLDQVTDEQRQAAKAEADGPDHYRVTGVAANDALNLRAAPNPKAARVGVIPSNANCVRNLGCRGGLSFQEYTTLSPAQQKARLRQHPRWCRVEYRGITGWAAGRFLTEGNCP